MAIFKTTKIEEKPSTFAEQLSKIKSHFKIAYENANNLHAEMESEIAKKQSQITTLQEDIKNIDITKKETETFMSNIEKFI